MTDLDRALHETLTRVADDDVHVDRLLAGARTAGVRYRRRRRWGLALGATGLSAGAGAVVLSLTAALSPGAGPVPEAGLGPGVATPSPPPSPSSSPSPRSPRPAPMTVLPTPPVAPGAPTAVDSADAVGQPLMLHLGLARLPFPIIGMQYQQLIDERQESLVIDGVDDDGQSRTLIVRVGADTKDFEPLTGKRTAVRVAGRPGTFALEEAGDRRAAVLRWKTANGLWMQVAGARGQDDALAVAASVRLDRTYRCVAPYRLRSLPAAMTPESCSVVFRDARATSMLSVSDGSFHVLLTTESGGISDANDQIGGRPARVVEHRGDGGAPIMEVAVDQGSAVLSLTASGRYDPTLVRRIAADCDWTGGPDPATWPVDPFTGDR
ncbi:hypothetical protein [Micromonospora costi]|uniref:Uncharacterized protein n=1 Tax=Micromonospora costi TaxID=1530042 RepID=A0A3A9ZXL0_9ACTN|nr:hypothetical protein [Micromonospora costi]RKN52981.1 hypothetical protein D7193_24625 [Micromonospora costi]